MASERRVHVNIRVRQATLDQADGLAETYGLRRAEVLRVALAAGLANDTTLHNLLARASNQP